MSQSGVPIRRRAAQIASLCLLLMACALPGSSAEGSRRPHGNNKPDFKREVEQMEQIWRQAQLTADEAAMDKLLSEDYIGITMNGQVVTKAQQLDRVRTRQLQLTKIDLSDVKYKLIGNTAIVTCQAEVEGTNEGTPLHGIYRYTRVYQRLPSGIWKITNFEATRVGPPPQGRATDAKEQAAPHR